MKIIFYPLIYSAFCALRGLFGVEKGVSNKIWIYTTLSGLGELVISIIILIVTFVKRKGHKRESTTPLEKGTSYQKKKKRYLNLLLLSVFNYLICFVIFLVNNKFSLIEYGFKMIQLIYSFYISNTFLKEKFVRHRIVSVIFIVMALIGSSIISVIQNLRKPDGSNPPKKVFNILLIILTQILITTKHMGEKLLMDNKFVFPAILLLFEGVVGTILNVIMMVIFSQVKCGKIFAEYNLCKEGEKAFSLSSLIADSKNLKIYVIPLIFISSMGIEYFACLTNLKLNPSYNVVFDLLTSLVFVVLDFFNSKEVLAFNILNLIFYIICLFFGLIYNEVIILNKFEMNRDTTVCISRRGDEEYKSVEEELRKSEIFSFNDKGDDKSDDDDDDNDNDNE